MSSVQNIQVFTKAEHLRLQSELATVQSAIKSELDRALDALFAAKEEVRKAREARAAGLAQIKAIMRQFKLTVKDVE